MPLVLLLIVNNKLLLHKLVLAILILLQNDIAVLHYMYVVCICVCIL